MPSPEIKNIVIAAFFGLLLLAGCKSVAPTGRVVTPAESSAIPSELPQATPTLTPTPELLALTVNGEGVPLSEYQAQLAQLVAADEKTGTTRTPEEQQQAVLDELINQTLMAQVAFEGGFELDEAGLQERVDALTAQIGGQAALDEWITANGYTEENFRSALRRAAASAWQRDVVINTIPDTAEQVRAQQILVRTEETAIQLHSQLEGGADFATLAVQYDPITGGMLGWFPRGYLTQPAVEAAAFALMPGEFSPVIETDFGYHIVYILERENDRILSVDARATLQHKVLSAWLESLRESSTIEILLP